MDEERNDRFWTAGFLTKENLRDFSICLVLIVLAVKICQVDVEIDFSGFNFTDLLSMLMAFFATALSAAFYFKANESSNIFYNNSYRFTKEVSEILGRIEAGFGERLRHIDEGYAGLSVKMDRFDLGAAKEEERKEEEHIEEQKRKSEEIVIDLMKRAKVADGEKAQLLDQLRKYSMELDRSNEELRILKDQIIMHEDVLSSLPLSNAFIDYVASKLDAFQGQSWRKAPHSVAFRAFEKMFSQEVFNSRDREQLFLAGMVDAEGKLTEEGKRLLRMIMRRK